MAANPTAAESSHTDANQQFSVVLVQGTLGTADTGGTARTVPASGDPLTGAAYSNNIGSFMPYIPLVDIQSYGTSGTVALGTLIAAPGSGTHIYIVGFSIDGDTAPGPGTAEVCLSFGSVVNGQGVLHRSTIQTQNTAINRDFTLPVNSGTTNAPLTYQIISGAGSIAWNVQYFIA